MLGGCLLQANGAAPGAGAASDNAAQLLKVIAAAAAEFPPNQATQLSNQLLRALRGFSLAPSAAAAHVSAVAQLTRQHGKGAMGWVPELLSGAEKVRCLSKRCSLYCAHAGVAAFHMLAETCLAQTALAGQGLPCCVLWRYLRVASQLGASLAMGVPYHPAHTAKPLCPSPAVCC